MPVPIKSSKLKATVNWNISEFTEDEPERCMNFFFQSNCYSQDLEVRHRRVSWLLDKSLRRIPTVCYVIVLSRVHSI